MPVDNLSSKTGAQPPSASGASSGGHRPSANQKGPLPPPITHHCRICRKALTGDEKCHICSTCAQPVCDDCSSYSSRDEAKHWMCSFCKRRGTQPAIPLAALNELGLNKMPSVRRMTALLEQGEIRRVAQAAQATTASSSANTQPNASKKRQSIGETPRQMSLEVGGSRSGPGAPTERRYSSYTPSPLACSSGMGGMTGSFVQGPSQAQMQQKPPTQETQRFSYERTDSFSGGPVRSVSSETLSERRSSSGSQTTVQTAMLVGSSSGKPSEQGGHMSATGPPSPYMQDILGAPGAYEEEVAQHQYQGLHRRRSSYSGSDSSLDDNFRAPLSSSLPYQAHPPHPLRSHPDLEAAKSAGVRPRSSSSGNRFSFENLELQGGDASQMRRSSGRRLPRQKRSLTAADDAAESEPLLYSPTGDEHLSHSGPIQYDQPRDYPLYCDYLGQQKFPQLSRPPRRGSRQQIDPHHEQLRHIRSDGGLYGPNTDGRGSAPYLTHDSRRTSDSSTDFSDMRLSPPLDSLTPSSPDFGRSPRQSGDSDVLGLPAMGPIPGQRRSIPSVSINNYSHGPMGMSMGNGSEDPNHLSLKDAFQRRSSTGRALPRVPNEQSRSLLDLPHGRTPSTHSLDLPNRDAPRRASAPEGENIRIVIDDVDSSSNALRRQHSQYERIILHRDDHDRNARTQGFGIRVMGGKLDEKDGKLYAYAAWILPGGPADRMHIKPGDKIMEWDGKSLVNLTYEQVCCVIENSGNTAELIIEPVNRTENRGHAFRQRRRLSQQQASIDFAAPTSSPSPTPSLSGSRRKLPQTPQMTASTSGGEILLQAWIDPDRPELVIVLICAKRVPNIRYPCSAQVRILPDMFKVCKSEPSLTLEWNETYIFQSFPLDKVNDMAVEITIFEHDPNAMYHGPAPMAQPDRAVAETIIPLGNALSHHTDWWPLIQPHPWPQRDHNRSNSLEMITLNPQESLDNQYPGGPGSRSVPGSRRGSGRILPYDPLPPPSATASARSSPRRSFDENAGLMVGAVGGRASVSGSIMAINIHPASGSASPTRRSSVRTPPRSSITELHRVDSQPTPPPLMEVPYDPKTRRKSSSALASVRLNRTSSIQSEDSRDGDYAGQKGDGRLTRGSSSDMTTSESDSAGARHAVRQHLQNYASYTKSPEEYEYDEVAGEIKLGFVMTKGFLEVEVVSARHLPLNANRMPPDTYVKTYLRDLKTNRHLHKKKTRVVSNSCEPQYRQTLKYDAALIHGRNLLVSVWQKQKGFEHNTPIGAAEVPLDRLQLHKLTIEWYKLMTLEALTSQQRAGYSSIPVGEPDYDQ